MTNAAKRAMIATVEKELRRWASLVELAASIDRIVDFTPESELVVGREDRPGVAMTFEQFGLSRQHAAMIFKGAFRATIAAAADDARRYLARHYGAEPEDFDAALEDFRAAMDRRRRDNPQKPARVA